MPRMPGSDVSLPASGAYAQLEQLIALRFSARQLRLTRRKRALSNLAGPNKTNFRGRGIDFEEVRAYQSGDDIRSIDWRVTARTGNAHTKLFREERERPVMIVVDQRAAMFFGSTHCCKSVLGAHLAGLLAWAALHGGDRVGGLVFDDDGHREIRPRRSRRTVLALLSEIARYNHALPSPTPAHNGGFSTMLGNLRRIARPGSSVFLVSDFHGSEEEQAAEQLYELAKHTEITALVCADPLEAELPRAGTYAVTDGRSRSELRTGDRRLRARYRDDFAQRREALSRHLRRLGIPLLAADTDQSPYNLLQTYYGEPRR
tara:strand:- start:290 stop:1240 length:951 start_codon:yes stop_codon:yes gene_type:complete